MPFQKRWALRLTHEEMFPHVKTIWLDQGRDVPDSSVIMHYARDRLAVYKSYLLTDISIPSTETLEAMSRNSWKRTEVSGYERTDRDSKFASHILEAITKNNPAWAIAIVGASHASESPGCMRALLEPKGVLCKVAILKRKINASIPKRGGTQLTVREQEEANRAINFRTGKPIAGRRPTQSSGRCFWRR